MRSIAFNFSNVFDGIVWNIKASREHEMLVLEIRNNSKKEVRFAAFNYTTKKFLWEEKLMEEPWWINLSAVSGKVILFTVYVDTNNPDKKATIAYNLEDCGLIWWNNDFSLNAASGDYVIGTAEKFGRREVVLDINTGRAVESVAFDYHVQEDVLRPQQYFEGHEYFKTVKTFFTQKFNLLPITALEYLEYDSLIIVSCYFHENDLANYLFIISSDGNLLLKEKLDDQLKGIGLDTFFVLSGCVFFVKNKSELVSYKIL